MAGNTLATLLIKLGFDMTGLASGGAAANATLNSIGQSAANVATMAAPATAALNNLNKAANAIQAGTPRQSSLIALANAAADVAKTTNGAQGPMREFARAAATVGESTKSGLQLNTFARAISAVALAAGPNAGTAIQNFARGAAQIAKTSPGDLPAFTRSVLASAAAMNAAAAAAPTAAANLGAVSAAGGAAATGGQMAAGGMNAASGAALRSAGSFRQAAAAMDMASDRGSFLNRTLSMAFAFSGGVAVTNVFSFLANSLIGFNSRLEQAHIAFSTLMGDAAAGDRFITMLEQFANITPFEFGDLQDAAQRLMAVGFAGNQVLPVLQAVGDAVSAVGFSKDKIDRVTLALGQMLTAGRVNAQDMRQLTEANIPAWDILSKGIGKTVAETRKLAETGNIPAGQALEILVKGMEERFSGMMARQARTAAGAFSTIKDAALQLISGAVQPAFAAISQGMIAIADFLTHGGGRFIVPVIDAIGLAIGGFLLPRLIGVVGAAANASVGITAFSTTLGGLSFTMTRLPIYQLVAALSLMAFAWQENFGGIRDTLGPVVDQIGKAVGVVLQLAGSSGLLVPIIIALSTAFAVRLVGGLIQTAIATVAQIRLNYALATSFTMVGGAASLSAVGTARMGLASAGAAAGTGGLAIAMRGLTAAVGGVMGVMVIWAGIIAFVATHLDELARGAVAGGFLIIAAVKGISDALLRLAGAPDQVIEHVDAMFNHLLDTVTDHLNELGNKINSAQTDIGGPSMDTSSFKADIDRMLAEFKVGTDGVGDSTKALVDQFGYTIAGVISAARDAGGKAMDDMAAAIRDHAHAVTDAFGTLRDLLATSLTPSAEIARLVGELASSELAAGLIDNRADVRAAAEALQKEAIARLNELTDGAYSAGQAGAQAFKVGLGDEMRTEAMKNQAQAQVEAWNRVKPSVTDVSNAMKDLNAELAKTANSAAASALNSAFADIRSTAHSFFDQLHQDNLRAIDEALRHKNAILDAKEALNQAPVTAAQKALDYQRRVIEEWRLRNAIATAQTPEAYRDAVLALQDFLAQQHINEMQAAVDATKDKIDAQKNANQDQADAQKDAENERYRLSVAAFDRDLALLEQHLADSHTAWQTGEDQILSLLSSYGVKYGSVGAALGITFVANLRDQIDSAITALQKLESGLPGGAGSQPLGGGTGIAPGEPGSTVPSPSGRPVPLDVGAWNVMQNELLAYVHRGEMVVPATVATQLRRAMLTGGFGSARDGGSTFGRATSGFAQAISSQPTGPVPSGGTVVLKVGEESFGEITDRRLSVQSDVYGSEHRLDMSSQR